MVELMKLTGETIGILSAKITEMYVSCGANRKETIRAQLFWKRP